MKDDLQRFRVFNAALRLITKTADERGQELSEQMGSLITDITSLALVVVRTLSFLLTRNFYSRFTHLVK